MRLFISLIFLSGFGFSESYSLQKTKTKIAKSLFIAQPNDQSNRLFIVSQKGTIHIIQNGRKVKNPFLDISHQVHSSKLPGSEEGLLGLAFHPNYQENGFIYVNYVNKNDSSIVARFQVSTNPNMANPSSELILLSLAQPFGNHNGGHLAFGPNDGFLYIAFGDGGKFGDPFNHAQQLNNWFGKILRIDVDSGHPYTIPKDNPFINTKYALPEIWCYGLRNPWRFSFDQQTGDLLIGDVGQDLWEEINWVSYSESRGINFGWKIMEGNHCYSPEENCEKENLALPIYEYPNNANYMKILMGFDDNSATGCSVTGGYVYRGKAIPELRGRYIFGDYCTGRIWSFKKENNQMVDFRNEQFILKNNNSSMPQFISSFGEDQQGELYIVDYMGAIYKFVP